MRGDWAKNGLGLDMKLGTEMKHYDQNWKYSTTKSVDSCLIWFWWIFLENMKFMFKENSPLKAMFSNSRTHISRQFWNVNSRLHPIPAILVISWKMGEIVIHGFHSIANGGTWNHILTIFSNRLEGENSWSCPHHPGKNGNSRPGGLPPEQERKFSRFY